MKQSYLKACSKSFDKCILCELFLLNIANMSLNYHFLKSINIKKLKGFKNLLRFVLYNLQYNLQKFQCFMCPELLALFKIRLLAKFVRNAELGVIPCNPGGPPPCKWATPPWPWCWGPGGWCPCCGFNTPPPVFDM